jgi:D-3-phosphoglycerate dehydrogenase
LIKKNKWVRLIGNEIYKKKIGVFGLGSVGKEVVKRSLAFGMEVYAFDKYEDADFIKKYNINFSSSFESFISKIDYMSLNLPLNEFTFHLINKDVLKKIKTNLVIINTARADLVDQNALLESIKNSKIRGYLTDVLEKEPMIKNHPLLNFKNVIITPHIGSRNHETVQRQGLRSVENLSNFLNI